jgi:hypothetical protein
MTTAIPPSQYQTERMLSQSERVFAHVVDQESLQVIAELRCAGNAPDARRRADGGLRDHSRGGIELIRVFVIAHRV